MMNFPVCLDYYWRKFTIFEYKFNQMQELRISKSKNIPEITLNPEGFIRLAGRSIHENITDYFIPVEEWINEYLRKPAELTCIDINLEYFNSASAKMLIHIFQKVAQVRLKDKKFKVNWYYEDGDEDILERGEYFSSILNIPFNFIKIT